MSSFGVHGAQILAVNDHLTGGGAFQQVDAPNQRGLACTAHADDAKDVAVLDCDVDIVQRSKLAIGGGEHLGDML